MQFCLEHLLVRKHSHVFGNHCVEKRVAEGVFHNFLIPAGFIRILEEYFRIRMNLSQQRYDFFATYVSKTEERSAFHIILLPRPIRTDDFSNQRLEFFPATIFYLELMQPF